MLNTKQTGKNLNLNLMPPPPVSQQQQPASLPTEQHHPFIPTIIIHIVNMDKQSLDRRQFYFVPWSCLLVSDCLALSCAATYSDNTDCPSIRICLSVHVRYRAPWNKIYFQKQKNNDYYEIGKKF